MSRLHHIGLKLVGNSVLLDSMHMIRRGGRLCLAVFLSSLDPVKDLNPLPEMLTGGHFSFFSSFVFGAAKTPSPNIEPEGAVKTWIL